ncbi:MAG: helix-turn-helix transcriptional regulator [Subdoligranulum sp.]|nr:helix-turn-helix transcriptional regulator [Subdoligranulum sp.]
MRRARAFSRMPKLFRRMFWRNYLIFAVIASVLSAAVLSWVLYETAAEQQRNTQRMARDLAAVADGWMTSCQNLSATVGQLAAIQELAAGDAYTWSAALADPTQLSAAQHALVTARAWDTRIARTAVYFYDREYVVTDQGTVTLDWFYQTLFATNAVPQSEYLCRLGPGQFLFLRQGAVDAATPDCPVYVTSVIDRDGNRYGNLFVFLDSRELRREAEAVLQEEAYFALYDGDGVLVYAHESAELTKPELLARAQQTGDASVVCRVNTYSGWEVCAGLPGYLFTGRLLSRGMLAALMWAVLLMLGAPVVLAICRRNYAPIQELARMISPQDGAAQQEMEYETLQAVIASIFADRQMLKEQIQIYKPMLVNSLLLELLDGAQPKDITRNALHTLRIDLPFEYWCCICVLVGRVRHDALVAFARQVRQRDGVACRAITHGRRACTFVLNAASRELCAQAAAELGRCLKNDETVQGWGMSETVTDPDHLNRAYQHARAMLDYTVPERDGCGVDWTALQASGILDLRPPDTVKNLYAMLSVGRIPEARRCVQEYFSCIVCGGYVKKEHLSLLQEMMLSALLKLRQEYDFDCSTGALQQWSADERGAACRLHLLCEDSLEELDGIMRAWQSDQQAQRENSIMEYLNIHLFDEDLSLSKLSMEFGVSESVISRRIKALSGENFLDYVNQKRIEHAGALLRQTDVSVNDLAAAVGYGNDITFRRSFKKYMGVTPSEYRRVHAPESR